MFFRRPKIYERFYNTKQILVLLSFLVFLFWFWDYNTDFSFYLDPSNNKISFEIGSGSMLIRDSVLIFQQSDITLMQMNPLFVFNTNYRQAIFFQSIYPGGYIPSANDMDNFDPLLLLFRNSVFTSESVVVRWNGYHFLTLQCHPRYWNASTSKFYNISKISYYKYKSVVCLGHQHTSDFGHWFLEVLPCFFAVPQWILDSSIVIVPYMKKYIIEDLALFNIPPDRILEGKDNYFYAENLYIMHSKWCGDLSHKLIQNMKIKFMQIFELNKEPPYRYVLYNRFNMSREIENWDEVMAAVKTQHPSINWENGQNFYTIREQAKYFNTIKLFFAVHGSILANIIFMQSKTSVIELQMEKWLLSFIHLGGYTEINMIEGRDASIMHIPVQKTPVDALYIAKLISLGIQRLGM